MGKQNKSPKRTAKAQSRSTPKTPAKRATKSPTAKPKKVDPWKAAEAAAANKYRDILASYSNAVATRRSTGWSWSTQPQSLWAMPQWELISLRNRCRSLEHNNALAKGMLDRVVDNVVGTGFQLQPESGDPEWNKKALDLFHEWQDYADITGIPWVERTRLIFRSALRDGDIGDILLDDGRLQAIEGDLIRTPGVPDIVGTADGMNGGRIIEGVEINSLGRPLAYHVDSVGPDGKPLVERVDANDFILFKRVDRLPQLRGTPVFSQTAELFDQIDKWIEALVVSARLAACVGLLIKKNNPQNYTGNFGTTANSAGQQQRNMQFEPGMVAWLEANEDVVTVDPSQPQQSFPESLAMLMRIQGTALGLPLELSLIDFSRTSYNSARAALQQAYRKFLCDRKLFTDAYLSRIYRWRISKFIKDGELEYRPDAWKHRWIGQHWPYLDPLKEVQGQALAQDFGIQTLSHQLREQGSDLSNWITTRGDEIAAMKAANIPLMHHSMSMPFDGSGNAPQGKVGIAGSEGDENEPEDTE